jgi:hypothetical protein
MTDALETRIREALAIDDPLFICDPDEAAPILARALEAAKSKLPLVEVWRYQEADDAFIAALQEDSND